MNSDSDLEAFRGEARDWLARYRPLSESPPDDALARHLEARLPSTPRPLAAVPLGLLLLALPLMAAGSFLAVRKAGLAAILAPVLAVPAARKAGPSSTPASTHENCST